MGQKRQKSQAEFQVGYVGSPGSTWWSTTPYSLRLGCTQWPPSKEHCVERGNKRGALQWRNVTNTTLAGCSKAKSAVIFMSIVCALALKWGRWLRELPPENPSSHFNGEKNSRQIFIEGHPAIYLASNFSKQKTRIDTFPKKTSRWLRDTWKDAQHHSASGKHKSKPWWDTTSHCQNG